MTNCVARSTEHLPQAVLTLGDNFENRRQVRSTESRASLLTSDEGAPWDCLPAKIALQQVHGSVQSQSDLQEGMGMVVCDAISLSGQLNLNDVTTSFKRQGSLE